MNDSVARLFGTVLIVVALVLVAFGRAGEQVATAVLTVGLLVGGCLLRIEAAILRGQPAAPDEPRLDPAQTWRRRADEVLHLPERTDRRPWEDPEDPGGPEPGR